MIYILKLIGIIVLLILAIFSLKRAFYCILNIIALKKYEKDPSSLPHKGGIVFNKKTGKLEADNSPILPWE